MVYRVLKVLVKLTMFFFFRKRIVQNAERIPSKGATILVANHPATFLDPLLVAVATKRQVHFLAKGAMFRNRLIRSVFKAFNMIPIYRAQDNPSDMTKNQDTFNYCYEHLETGGLVLIFPEGISLTNRTLNPLKTGAARIALGAEERNDFKLGVRIVPIGLTYEAPHQFRKDVLVNVGQPIQISAFQENYQEDNRKTVKQVIEEVDGQLKDLTLNVEDPELTPLVDFYLQENASKDIPFKENVKRVKEVITIISGTTSNQASELEVKINRVNKLKEEIGFDGFANYRTGNIMLNSLLSLFTLIVGIPMFIYGFIHNAIPYYLSPRLAKLISKEYEYQGPITMTAGMVICLILYPLLFVLMYQYCESWLCSLIYLISLPLVGVVTYGFYEQLIALKLQWKLLLLFSRNRSEVSQLVLAQKELLQLLNSYSRPQNGVV